jgi:zeta-carotene desaturase
MYEDGPDGLPVVTGLRMSRAGQERIVKADAYVAALDVPGAKKLIPQVLPPRCWHHGRWR